MAVPLAVAAAALAAGVALTACTSSRPGTPHPAAARPAASSPAAARLPPPSPTAAAQDRRAPAPVNHCAGNSRPRLVKVDLFAQRAWMCAGARTVRTVPITSGASALPYRATPTGRFAIQGRNRDTTLTLSNGDGYAVEYWIPFDAPLYGFHDASWQTFPLGSPRYKREGSHGCIHLSLAALQFLYRWATIGTPVLITR